MYKLYILSCVISEIGYISYKLQLSRLIAGLPWLSIICIPTSDLPCDGNATGMFAFFGTVGYFFLKWHSYFTAPNVHTTISKLFEVLWGYDNIFSQRYLHSNATHRGAFCLVFFWLIYYCHSSKSTGKETGKIHLCATG